MPAAETSSVERLQPADRAAWRAWLAAHHGRGAGIWLVYGRKGGGAENLTTAEAVEEALCFGWIDSLPRKLDDARSLLWFAPRKPGSGWSRVNKERIARLERADLIADPGRARIAAAKRDGSWAKLDAVETFAEPPDLAAALAARPAARAHWDAFPRSVRRGILEWIHQAKKPDTRAARIAETAARAAENLRANQWRQPAATARPRATSAA